VTHSDAEIRRDRLTEEASDLIVLSVAHVLMTFAFDGVGRMPEHYAKSLAREVLVAATETAKTGIVYPRPL